MSKVYDILKKKNGMIFSVKPQDTLRHTLKLMAEMNIGAVLIVDGGKILGIFSERDFARNSAKGQVRVEEIAVQEMMTTSIVSIAPSQTTEECMALMTAKRIRHLPVIENDKLVGLISIGDVVKQVIEDQKFSITQLERYVAGDSYN